MGNPGKNEALRKNNAFLPPKSLGILAGTLHVCKVFFNLFMGNCWKWWGDIKSFLHYWGRIRRSWKYCWSLWQSLSDLKFAQQFLGHSLKYLGNTHEENTPGKNSFAHLIFFAQHFQFALWILSPSHKKIFLFSGETHERYELLRDISD